MSLFHPVDRKAPHMFPPSVEHWLPEDHLACVVVEALEPIDLSSPRKAYDGRGSTA